MGIFSKDNSIKDGKNLLNFMLIYLVGYEIKTNVIFKKIKLTNIVVYFISYNVLFVVLLYIWHKDFGFINKDWFWI